MACILDDSNVPLEVSSVCTGPLQFFRTNGDELCVSLQSKRGGRPLKVVPENAIKEKSVIITNEMMNRFRLEMDIGT